MKEEYNRTVLVTARFLKKLDNSQRVFDWAKDRYWAVEIILNGYEQLTDVLNSIPDRSRILGVMPKTGVLKETLNGIKIPYFRDISSGNFAYGLMEARGPMLMGQKIKNSEIVPTQIEKDFAIGTPSMETTPSALVVGTVGHLSERTFFQWARKNAFAPEGGWKKDGLLQAFDEGLMLMLARGERPILTDFFTKSTFEGGLGWLNDEKVEKFKMKLDNLV